MRELNDRVADVKAIPNKTLNRQHSSARHIERLIVLYTAFEEVGDESLDLRCRTAAVTDHTLLPELLVI